MWSTMEAIESVASVKDSMRETNPAAAFGEGLTVAQTLAAYGVAR
jgi:hypothetical protein